MYVRIRLNFEKNAVSNGKHAVTDLVWHVGSSGSVQVPVGSNLSIKNTTAPYTATQGSGSMKIAIQYVSGSGNKMQEIVFSDVSGSKSGVWRSMVVLLCTTARTTVITKLLPSLLMVITHSLPLMRAVMVLPGRLRIWASHPLRPLRLPLLLATKERRSNNKHCGRERGSPLSLI